MTEKTMPETKQREQTKMKNEEAVKYDVELSMGDNQLTLVVMHPNRTHRAPITPQDALSLSKKLEKGAKFLGETDVS